MALIYKKEEYTGKQTTPNIPNLKSLLKAYFDFCRYV